jgi:hypothetical protein
MSHSTLTIHDYQFLHAFRELFTPAVLRQAVAQRRCPTRERALPLWLLLGLLVAWFWMPADKLPWLIRWVRPSHKKRPSDSAVYQARGRLGWAPLRWLRTAIVRPLADPRLDPTAFYHTRRLMGIDGTTLTCADAPANARTFGRAKNQHRSSGYPLIRVVALCELGTHALVDWIARGYHQSENRLARRLLRRVPSGSLLLMDRNFHSFDLWQAAHANHFDLLIRVQNGPRFPAEQVLADGSYLSRVRPKHGKPAGPGIVVRVIRYCWTEVDGTVHESRLVTNLLDAATEPAAELVDLYHTRWEEELAFGEVKKPLGTRVTHIRACDPVRAVAELDGLLLGHWVVRWVMVRAAREAGVAPVALSFVGVLRVFKTRLSDRTAGRGRAWWHAVLVELGQQRLPKRRRRQCPRVRKTTRSHWPVKKEHHKQRPLPTLTLIKTDKT